MKPDLIPKLHLLKPNAPISILVTIMVVTMAFVSKGQVNVQWSKKVLLKLLLFLSGFSFTKIHDSQDSRARGCGGGGGERGAIFLALHGGQICLSKEFMERLF